MVDKGILELVQSSKNISDADSEHENEMNNVVPVPLVKSDAKRDNSKKKIRSFKISITYAWETWFMSRTDENMIGTHERKILTSIFGGIQENGIWRRRSNLELY
ncbi:hypothetical protein TNCV_408071 [Trichonephila clavipes]|nr:hypothetical protein TNCV_408071 [Trichonephila clavipes]